MAFSADTSTRTLELARAIALAVAADTSRVTSRDTEQQTLQLVEAIARDRGILPQLPSDEGGGGMATVTKSIGSTGRDYSTITSWESDLDNSGVYSAGDDAVGECYNDSEFDESVTIDGGGTVGLNSVTLTVAAGERHDGTAGTGARIVRTGNEGLSLFADLTRSLKLLEIDLNGNGGICVFGDSSGAVLTFSQGIWHGGSSAGGGVTSRAFSASTGHGRLFNNLAYDFLYTGGSGAAPRACILSELGTNFSFEAYNNTVHDATNDGDGDGDGLRWADSTNNTDTVQNNLVTSVGGTTGGSTQCFNPSTVTNGTADHNASSDATASGTGSLTNITTADQYVSTVSGSEDLHLKSGADVIDAGTDLGTTPTGVSIDIDGRDRDAEGDTWDIGADEFVSSASSVSGNISQLSWNTQQVINNKVEVVWNVLDAIRNNIVLRWDVSKTISNNIETLWNVSALAGNNKEILWNILSNIGQDVENDWNVLQNISNNTELVWNVLNEIGQDTQQNWNVLQAIGDVSELEWGILSNIKLSQQTNWNILKIISNNTELEWNILSTTPTASNIVQLIWNVNQVSNNKANITWNTLQNINKEKSIEWADRILAGKHIDHEWNIRAVINNTQLSTWNIFENVGQKRQTNWNVLQTIAKENELLWNTLVTLASAGNIVELNWRVRQLSSKEQEMVWRVLSNLDITNIYDFSLFITQIKEFK